VILKDPEVFEVLQRVEYYDGVEGCIKFVGFACIAVFDTPVMNVGQGYLVLEKVCYVGWVECALDLPLAYKLLLHVVIHVRTVRMMTHDVVTRWK
jgi:hypothetical protein